MTRIKICGLTQVKDAQAAAEAGADALGFILAPSKRQISPDTARKIIEQLPAFVTKVGVIVDVELAQAQDILEDCGFDLLQLHGRETAQYCASFKGRAIKVFRMDEEFKLGQIDAYTQVTRALLLDSGAGGTGRTFDWSSIPEGLDRRWLILAGGLGPDNVVKAIKTVKPWAVDVSSGIEIEPGRKDIGKMKEFIKRVREADHGSS